MSKYLSETKLDCKLQFQKDIKNVKQDYKTKRLKVVPTRSLRNSFQLNRAALMSFLSSSFPKR